MTPTMCEELALQIGPTRQTIYHVLNKSIELCRFFHSKLNEVRKENGEEDFPVPFIQNILGQTPLHMVLQKDKYDAVVAGFFIGELLPPMPYDHHGRAVFDILPDCVEIPGFTDYLNSRFFQTTRTEKASRINKHSLRKDDDEEEKTGLTTVTNQMFDKEDIQQKLFKEDKIDTKAEVFTCDIPNLHDPRKEECHEFYENLMNHGNEDLELYKCQALKNYIKFNWPIVKEYVEWRLLLPYIVYMFGYILYALWLYDYDNSIFSTEQRGWTLFLHIFDALLLAVGSFYFLRQEFR